MKEVSDTDDSLSRFLLGDLTEPERAEMEDRLLADEELYERMLAAEGDLVDAYARGELTATERAQFEKSFLSSAPRRQRVHFAQGLAETATRLHEEESARPRAALASAGSPGGRGWLASLFTSRPAFGYALAAAALLVIATVVWLAVERMRAPVDSQRAQTEGVTPPQPDQRAQDTPQNGGAIASNPPPEGPSPSQRSASPTPEAPRAQSVFATITLAPGTLRDGAAGGNLLIPRAATHLRVRLQLEADNYQSYRATISTPEGRRVWSGVAPKDRRTDAGSVTLTLPADTLKRGDYLVELSGAVAGGRSEPAAQYSFRVTRED